MIIYLCACGTAVESVTFFFFFFRFHQRKTNAAEKNAGLSTIINDDDSDFEKTPPKKARGTAKGKKRKARVQVLTSEDHICI